MCPEEWGWCCTEHWQCLSRRRTWRWEGHSWEPDKSTIWWQVFYTTQTYRIKHEVYFKKHIFFCMYIWGSALTYTDKPQALVTVISVCLETDLINWTSHILVISVAFRAFYTNFSWATRNMIILYHTRLQRVFFNPCVICLFKNRRHWNNWKSWSGKAETTT